MQIPSIPDVEVFTGELTGLDHTKHVLALPMTTTQRYDDRFGWLVDRNEPKRELQSLHLH